MVAGETAALADAAFSSEALSSRSAHMDIAPAKKSTNPLIFIIPGAGAVVLLVVLLVIFASRDKAPTEDSPNYANSDNNSTDNNDVNNIGDGGGSAGDSASKQSDLGKPDSTSKVVRPLNQEVKQNFASNTNTDSTTVAPPPAAQKEMMLYWPMEGNLREEGGNGIHAMHRKKNIYIKSGYIGSALQLNGDEYIWVPHDAGFPVKPGKITLSAWVNLPDQGEQKPFAGIVTKGDTSWQLSIADSSNGQFRFAIGAGEEFWV